MDRKYSAWHKSPYQSDMGSQHRMSCITMKSLNSWPGTTIGLVTAGDDSQGMNAAIRAAVRTGMYVGATVIYIKHGLKGMVEGGDNFVEASWISTSNISSDGGTIIKSFKCPEFLERPARLKAAKNLLDNGIQYLIAIGGDGTLKALYILQKEWISLLRELDDKSLVDREVLRKYRHLRVVTVLASIANDVAGTDFTIGADSALHRIVEATDAIITTASSSQLAFIIEVMGKYSGYLALCTALCCDASMVFIPEWPPEGDWKEELFDKVKDDIQTGTEGIMVVVAEGAVDRSGQPIRAEDIKNALHDGMDLNAKITVLGHVQRGGTPSAYDRLIGTRMGAQSVIALMNLSEAGVGEEGCGVIGVYGNEIIVVPMRQCIEKTTALENHIKACEFADAVLCLGRHFQQLLSVYVLLHRLRSTPLSGLSYIAPGTPTIGLVKIGMHTLGHCALARAVVGYCWSKNYAVLNFEDGFQGILKQNGSIMVWDQVRQWSFKHLTCLGSAKHTAGELGLDKIATAIGEMNLSGLILIGGFTAYQSLMDMYEERLKYRQLCIPMCMVPVTSLNNVPGSEVCIGSDSTVNEICHYCDKMKRVATGQKNTVHVIETAGQNCGYLATIAGVCVGADAAYIRQEEFDIDTLLNDIGLLRHKILNSGVHTGLVIRSERANDNYTTDFIHKLFSEEGKGVFQCKASIIGPIQMGTMPSPQDRLQAILAGVRSAEWIVNAVDHAGEQDGRVYDPSPQAKCVLCFGKRSLMFKPVSKLACETDFQERMPTFNWWMKLRPLLRILAKHYEEDLQIEIHSDPSLGPGEIEPNSTMMWGAKDNSWGPLTGRQETGEGEGRRE